jgi:hypothetical protein
VGTAGHRILSAISVRTNGPLEIAFVLVEELKVYLQGEEGVPRLGAHSTPTRSVAPIERLVIRRPCVSGIAST